MSGNLTCPEAGHLTTDDGAERYSHSLGSSKADLRARAYLRQYDPSAEQFTENVREVNVTDLLHFQRREGAPLTFRKKIFYFEDTLLSATSSPVFLPLAPQSGSHITTHITSEFGHKFKRLKVPAKRGLLLVAVQWEHSCGTHNQLSRGRWEHRTNKSQITADGNSHSATHWRLGKFLSDQAGIQHVPWSRRLITYFSWYHPCQSGLGILQPFN